MREDLTEHPLGCLRVTKSVMDKAWERKSAANDKTQFVQKRRLFKI